MKNVVIKIKYKIRFKNFDPTELILCLNVSSLSDDIRSESFRRSGVRKVEKDVVLVFSSGRSTFFFIT